MMGSEIFMTGLLLLVITIAYVYINMDTTNSKVKSFGGAMVIMTPVLLIVGAMMWIWGA